jgi:hypothetical protein
MEKKTVDDNKTLIVCKTRNSPEPFSMKSVGIYIDNSYFTDYGSFKYKEYFIRFNDYELIKILKIFLVKKMV